MSKFKYIANISTSEVDKSVVIPCIDENGNHAILIKNSINKITATNYRTDNLIAQIDALLNLEDKEYYFHIITSVKNDVYDIEQFNIIFEYIFQKIEKPISGKELFALINSIEEYFKTSPDPELFSLQVGVFGELLTIKRLYDAGYPEILKKYHENFYSKHDVELDDSNRLEIKTTVSEKRIHTFKHNQIFRNDINVYVSSVMLEQSKEGLSLYELFQELLELYVEPDCKFALHKLMKKCGVDQDRQGLIFSEESAFNNLKIFDALELPKLEIVPPDSITNIKYDVDCSLANDMEIGLFIENLRKLA